MNLSEGRDRATIERCAAAAGNDLLDVHHDPDHHRSVLTLVGEEAPRAVARRAVELLDLRAHSGVHPRIGVVDVVPFVPLEGADMADAVAARDRFAVWAADVLGVPCFCYGPERTLPEVRRSAFVTLAPDTGPPTPHPSAGAMAVGARPALVAYNLWLRDADVAQARQIAARLRGPDVRALGLPVAGGAQVSLNLIAPARFGPADAYDAVAAWAVVERAELVGLVPAAVLDRVDPDRYRQLDLDRERTIEARLMLRRSRSGG